MNFGSKAGWLSNILYTNPSLCVQVQIAVPGKTIKTWQLWKAPVPALSCFFPLSLSLKQSVLMRIKLRLSLIKMSQWNTCITPPREILKRWHQADALSLTTKTASKAISQCAGSSHEVVKQDSLQLISSENIFLGPRDAWPVMHELFVYS